MKRRGTSEVDNDTERGNGEIGGAMVTERVDRERIGGWKPRLGEFMRKGVGTGGSCKGCMGGEGDNENGAKEERGRGGKRVVEELRKMGGTKREGSRVRG